MKTAVLDDDYDACDDGDGHEVGDVSEDDGGGSKHGDSHDFAGRTDKHENPLECKVLL